MATTIEPRRGGGVHVRRTHKRTRWTAKARATFLATLATSCNVTAAASKAKVNVSTAYYHRGRDAAFQAAWSAAIRQGYELLEMKLLERSVHGVKKPVFHAGAKIADVTEFNDARALALLKMHRDEAAATRASSFDPDEDERVLQELRARFRLMQERLSPPGLPAPAAEPEPEA